MSQTQDNPITFIEDSDSNEIENKNEQIVEIRSSSSSQLHEDSNQYSCFDIVDRELEDDSTENNSIDDYNDDSMDDFSYSDDSDDYNLSYSDDSDDYNFSYSDDYDQSDYGDEYNDNSMDDDQSNDNSVSNLNINDYFSLALQSNNFHTSISDNVIDLSNLSSIDMIDDDGRISRPAHSNNQIENDVVVLESTNLNEIFPRVNYSLVSIIVERLYSVYFGIKSPNKISGFLEQLTEEEIKFLKMKVKTILCGFIRDQKAIKELMEIVCKEKIDEEINISRYKKLASTYFEDMINIESKNCGICYGEFKNNQKCSSLKCLHTFHSKCIQKWIKRSWCCPMCRSEDIQ